MKTIFLTMIFLSTNAFADTTLVKQSVEATFATDSQTAGVPYNNPTYQDLNFLGNTAEEIVNYASQPRGRANLAARANYLCIFLGHISARFVRTETAAPTQRTMINIENGPAVAENFEPYLFGKVITYPAYIRFVECN